MQTDIGAVGDGRVMGDDDDTAVFLVGKPLQYFDNVAAVLAVKVARRLVA